MNIDAAPRTERWVGLGPWLGMCWRSARMLHLCFISGTLVSFLSGPVSVWGIFGLLTGRMPVPVSLGLLLGGLIARSITSTLEVVLRHTITDRLYTTAVENMIRDSARIPLETLADPEVRSDVEHVLGQARTLAHGLIYGSRVAASGLSLLVGWISLLIVGGWLSLVPLLLTLPMLGAGGGMRRLERTFAATQRLKFPGIKIQALLLDPGSALEARVNHYDQVLAVRARSALDASDAEGREGFRRAATREALLRMVCIGAVLAVVLAGHRWGASENLAGWALLVLMLPSMSAVISGLHNQGKVLHSGLLTFRAYQRLCRAAVPGIAGTTRAVPRGATIQVRSLRHVFGKDKTATRQVRCDDVTLRPGHVYVLIGPNGVGKSTFLEILSGLKDPDAGTICVTGGEEAPLTRFCPQSFGRFSLPLGESIAVGASNRPETVSVDRVLEALARAGREDLRDQLPGGLACELGRGTASGELSDGQWQAVALARWFIGREAGLAICDEGTAHLDRLATTRVRAEAQAWAGSGGIVVLVTQDPQSIEDDVVVLFASPTRGIVEIDPGQQLVDREFQVWLSAELATEPEGVS